MEQAATTLLPAARIAVIAAFVGLTLLALARTRRTGNTGRWVTAAFSAMATTLLIGWLPDLAGVEMPVWAQRLAVLLLLAFPYLLLRFTASFVPLPRWLEVAAGIAAVAAGVAALALVVVMDPITPTARSPSGGALLVVVLAYWVLVSLVTAWRLWRAGRRQPTVTRRSMRLMSSGTAILAIALLLAGRLADTSVVAALVVDVFALLSAAAFAVGFAPPRVVRRLWRAPEEEQLRVATVDVLRSHTVEEVGTALLPPTVRILNGAGAAMVDVDGQVVAAVGDISAVGTRFVPDGGSATGRDLSVPLGPQRGELVVRTGPYSRFFGSEDDSLLRSMAAVAELALERCELLAEERGQQQALRTAQQRAEQAGEEADRANRSKSEFLSRMSHELRTPLGAILGFGQLLQSAPLTDEDREGVDYILKAGRHLLALIDDVLDLSRIEAGMMTISLEPVHVAELTTDTLALIKPLADNRDIEIRFEVVPCDVYVMTDRQRARQVLLNLLSNAIKYNRDAGWVELRCRPFDNHLRIAVTDSGPGIDLTRRQQLFEPFERLGAEGSGVEGTGLGLALTKQLVERLDGNIGVASQPGTGATFWIDLPFAEQPTPHDEPPPSLPAPSAAGQNTLLLVEDNLANLRVVEAVLRRRPGIEVIPAMQGGLALELAYEHRPDAIILDLHLPDLTGLEVLHRLKADPRTRHIPVIIASADAAPGRMRHLREVGAYAYITKPFDLARFLALIDAALTGDDPAESGDPTLASTSSRVQPDP